MRAFLFVLLLLPAVSSARVFSYKEAGVAAYIRGTGGFSSLNQDAFANSSGNGVSVNGSSDYDYGGEIGFMFALSPGLHLRLGAEVLQYHPVVDSGVTAANTKYFAINSSVFVFNPNVAVEYVYSAVGNLRFFGELGVGYATVNATNDYTMTAAGTAALGGVTDFKETLSGNALSAIVGFGLEDLFTDNVTFLLDVGYRYLPVKALTYASSVNNIVKPAGNAAGDPVLNADGSARTLNLGGFFTGVSFRFYLNFF